ncbi:MAG: transcriptional repressor [Prevotella sp.]|nr:transcriptional repressor [Prevotella sp.]
MTDETYYADRLAEKGIKPTSTRLLVLREFFRGGQMVSLPELERCLPTVDKSTISRTLAIFLAHELIHAADDGTGAMKYALSDDTGEDVFRDGHIHFCCTECLRTFCLRDIHAPGVSLPAGFVLQGINYVIKGLCPECSYRRERRERRL